MSIARYETILAAFCNPIDFDDLWQRSIVASLGSAECRIAGIEDLIEMKTLAGRPQDLRDIEQLRRIQQVHHEGGT